MHWLELVLNGGDFFAAALMTPELLGKRRKSVEEWFRATIGVQAKLAAVCVPVLGFIFIITEMDMTNHLPEMVGGKRFDLLGQYSKGLLVVTILYGLVVFASFFGQYLEWADWKMIGKKKARQVFLCPGAIIFLAIRVISIAGALDAW